jgi:YidC/Oxa1 family membrane protein insertase
MEQVRLLVAIGLSFLVLFVWSVFFVNRTPVSEHQQNIKQQNTVAKEQLSKKENRQAKPTIAEKPIEKKAVEEIKKAQADENPARIVTVDTPLYSVRISAKGATFTSYILKKYRETVQKDSPYKELISPDFKRGILQTSLSGNSLPGLESAVYSLEPKQNKYEVKDNKRSLSFNWIAADGTVITKTYTFNPHSYLIDLNIEMNNASAKVLKGQLALSVRMPIEKQNRYGFVGPSGLINNKLEQIKAKKIEDKNQYPGHIKWIGVEDRYFLTSIIPAKESEGIMKLAENDNSISNQLVNPAFELDPGKRKEFKFLVFIGPKSMSLLNSLDHGLGKALYFGFFNIIAKPCLWLLNLIYSFIPNYGVAIILLTIFTKVILWPLGTKSYKSMSEMKKLQPLMAEIREKHKGDKQKMNQELMALYKTYKVNPMGGCLPMVLQIPVFFALYRMLYQAIELRHAPFFLWINDLSAPDRLFHFGVHIPFMQPPYGIPVLTIIMGGTMLLQQKMSPPPGDPTQAKMMMLMPVVFTFIFINFSSGLVLYWLVNNLLSISQQYYVQKKSA